jgi:hypothetical protein
MSLTLGAALGALHCRLEHESPVLDRPRWLPGQPCPLPPGKEDEVEQTEEPVELVERVGALDIGKATVTACVRVPHEDNPGRRRQEVREYVTRVPALLELTDWLRSQSVQLVAMEATSSYVLEAGVLSAGGRRVHLLAAERPPRQERPRPTQDRQAGRGVAGQGRLGVACAGRAWCTPSRSATCAT